MDHMFNNNVGISKAFISSVIVVLKIINIVIEIGVAVIALLVLPLNVLCYIAVTVKNAG